MKAHKMNRLAWRAPVCLGTAAALMQLGSGTATGAEEKKDSKEDAATEAAPGEYNNSITIGGGSYLIDGNKAQLQRNQRNTGGAFGGIEELHYEQAIGKKGMFVIDGKGLLGSEDYSIKLELSREELGYIKGGFSKFSSYYDGSGGYSATNNKWVNTGNDQMHVDRGEAWIEGRLNIPDWPVFTVGYTYQYREGQKDSTIWGDFNVNSGAGAAVLRGITPSFRDIDEKRHILNADVTHTIGNTDVGLGLRYDWADQNDSLNFERRNGEPKLDRFVTQKEKVESDMFNVRSSTETRISENVLFTTGAAFTRLDTDIGGSRIYGNAYDQAYNPNYANRQLRDEGFYNLTGGSRSDQYVANINLMFTPLDHVTVVPALRIEHQDQVGIANFIETNVTNATAIPREEDFINARNRAFTDVTESLDIRYSGITNWVFYARGEWLEGQGGVTERETDGDTGLQTMFRDTDSTRLVQKYSAGANWYPTRKVTLGGQYYYKERVNDYNQIADPAKYAPPATTDLYPGFIRQHDFSTHDMNARVTWRALANLTFVTRYDYQLSTIDTLGDVNNQGIVLNMQESSAATTHIFSESISWVPVSRLFVQVGGSYVMDKTKTPASNIGGISLNVVQDSDNGYWNANGTVGYALSQKADLLASYYYYKADDFIDNSAFSQPYGSGAEQHGVTTTLVERLRKNLIWKLQYGYFTYRDETYGGYNNYDAHLVYSSVQMLF